MRITAAAQTGSCGRRKGGAIPCTRSHGDANTKTLGIQKRQTKEELKCRGADIGLEDCIQKRQTKEELRCRGADKGLEDFFY